MKTVINKSICLCAPKRKRIGINQKRYVSIPDVIKDARFQGKLAFNEWKLKGYPTNGTVHDSYCAKRKVYRPLIRGFLNQLDNEKITTLCNAADSDEKLFWKLLKGQRSYSQMSAFLLNSNLIGGQISFVRS